MFNALVAASNNIEEFDEYANPLDGIKSSLQERLTEVSLFLVHVTAQEGPITPNNYEITVFTLLRLCHKTHFLTVHWS